MSCNQKPMPKIKVYPKVGKDVEQIFRTVISKLNSISEIPEEVELLLVPGASVAVNDGAGFGVFICYDHYKAIAIAGKYCNEMKKDLSRKEWLEILPETIAHEWAHMEQWRDGKPLNHKGIDKRVKQLLNSIN